jgi:hydrogenase expression/formation protein HypD
MNSISERIEYLRSYDGRPLRLMEVCGTHTAGIFKSGIRSILPERIRLISGPGCPVCVTPASYIDRCVEYARTPGCALVSFGDMMKVPGSTPEVAMSGGVPGTTERGGVEITAGGGAPEAAAGGGFPLSLDRAKGLGARVELVYSPFDTLEMAEREPETKFVIAAVGFETTVPAYALLMEEIVGRGLTNISLLTALKSALPAIGWVCENASVDGFLCPGHVSVITGSRVYEPLAEKYGKPFVVAGFEEAHLVSAIYELVKLASDGSVVTDNSCIDADKNVNVRASGGGGGRYTEYGAADVAPDDVAGVKGPSGRGAVVNLYSEAVTRDGNARARAVTDNYFERGAAVWRGIGVLAGSGLYLRPEYAAFDAGGRDLTEDAAAPEGCRCADVITGCADPPECPLFGSACTPDNARGPCMTSSEGACGIWYENAQAQ